MRYDDYVCARFEELPLDMKMSKQMRLEFKMAFDLFRDREGGHLPGKDAVEMFSEYSRTFKFKIPLQAPQLLQVASPYRDNLRNFVRCLF